MRIEAAGNIGIGTNNPHFKLDVNGDVYINNGQTDANQGGKLIFDKTYNGTGPNKINLHSDENNSDNRFGIGVFASEVRHHSESKHGFYYTTGGTPAAPEFSLGMNLVDKDLEVVGDLSCSGLSLGNSITIGTAATQFITINKSGLVTSNQNITVEPKGSDATTGKVVIKGGLQVDGSFNFTGEFIKTVTNVQLTDQLEISNDGTGPALKVSQTGTNDIAEFFDDGVSVFKIEDGGNVGISTNNPSARLEVVNDLTNQNTFKIKTNAAGGYAGLNLENTTAGNFIDSTGTGWDAGANKLIFGSGVADTTI